LPRHPAMTDSARTGERDRAADTVGNGRPEAAEVWAQEEVRTQDDRAPSWCPCPISMSCVTLVQVVGALDGCPVGLDDARVHHVECAQMLQGVSPADGVIVPAALRDQGSRRPGGDPPRMAIRSAMSSTMARTA